MVLSNAVILANIASGDALTVNSENNRVGINSTTPRVTLDVAGIVSATAFYGDGSNLEGVASAGLGTAINSDVPGLDVIYFTDEKLGIADTITVGVPTGANVAYTQYQEIVVNSGADFIVEDGDDFIPDILGIGSDVQSPGPLAGGGGRIRADNFTDKSGSGAPSFPSGIIVTGIATFGGGAPSFPSGIVVTGIATFGGNVTIGGTLTYEDVKNIDSVGLITARSGIEVVGFVTAQSGSAVTFSGGANITNAVETVNTGSYATGADPVSGITTGILTLDTKLGTVFTHDVGSNQAVGVVSITNFPVLKNSFHTVSVIFTSSGYGNTTTANGIGTNVTLTPENVSGFSTESRVGAGDSVVISTTSGRDDIITFGIHYNGSGTGTPANYKTYVSKNGDFRLIRG